jgi:hypothetical protein
LRWREERRPLRGADAAPSVTGRSPENTQFRATAAAAAAARTEVPAATAAATAAAAAVVVGAAAASITVAGQ